MVAPRGGNGKDGIACATLTQGLRPLPASGLQEIRDRTGILGQTHLPLGEAVKRTLIVAFVVAILAALALAGAASTKTVAVSIGKNGFSSSSLSISAGDVVMWKNDDTVTRSLVSGDAGITQQNLAPGTTFSFTFAKAGRFRVEDPSVKKRTQMFVTVAAAPLTVTLTSPKALVVYGGGTTLTGTVSTLQPNEQVTVLEQPCQATAPTKIATVATTSGGAYSVVVKPLKNTVYTVQAKTATSSTFAVGTKPKLTLTKPARGRFAIAVRGAISFSGRAVVLQRWNATLRRWVNVRSALLVKAAAATPPTVVSKASFRATVKPRTRMRVSISAFQAGTCYKPTVSNVVLA
jgi:plastocyanin